MSSLSCATIFKWRNMFGKFECKMCYLYYMGGGCLLNIDKLHFEPYVLNILIYIAIFNSRQSRYKTLSGKTYVKSSVKTCYTVNIIGSKYVHITSTNMKLVLVS